MIDGARNALGGYLYQILAGAGLAARAVECRDEQELLCALIIEARNARILYEMHGEDLVFRREDAASNSGILVQLKFSRHGAAELITPSELRDILRAFHRSAAMASVEFPVTGYVLVTNRDLTDKAREYHRQRTTPFDDLKRADRDWLNVPDSQKEGIEKDERFGTVEAAARAWYTVFQNLTIFPRVDSDHWYQALREYTTARGLYEHEFDPALSRLVGDAVLLTLQGPAEFSRGWLNRCLLRLPDARSLRLSASSNDSARQGAAEALRTWLERSLGVTEQALVRREYLDTLSEQLAKHSIVFVLGRGGCGKSTLAAHFLLESMSSRFVAAVSARDLHNLWLGQEFNAWRDPTSGREHSPSSIDDVLRRLRHANGNEPPPILLLDIDGLDEQGDRGREAIRALVGLCRPRVVGGGSDLGLILTARANASRADRALRELIADLFSAEYPGDMEDQFGVVWIDDFTEAEFVAVLRHVDVEVRTRLQAAVGTMAGTPPDTTVAESAMTPGAPSPLPEMVESLRHPVLWGFFSRLTVEEQHQVLDGADAGLDRLTERFVERFCVKVYRRRSTLQGERARRALVQVARSFPPHQALARFQTNWIAQAAPLVTQDEAAFLFAEAVSYGMIREEEPGRWAWRHRFLRESLARQEA
jgi:energy-coupling factor transporter ATP-binding protein EcfA2